MRSKLAGLVGPTGTRRSLAPMYVEVILTATMPIFAMLLFAMALVKMWPREIAEMPRQPCGFAPPS